MSMVYISRTKKNGSWRSDVLIDINAKEMHKRRKLEKLAMLIYRLRSKQ